MKRKCNFSKPLFFIVFFNVMRAVDETSSEVNKSIRLDNSGPTALIMILNYHPVVENCLKVLTTHMFYL